MHTHTYLMEPTVLNIGIPLGKINRYQLDIEVGS